MTHKAKIGSVSDGTLRTQDLIAAFFYELHKLDRGTNAYTNLLQEARDWDDDEEAGAELVQDLIDALNAYAPPYCYFGSNEGDGASFGFWPCMDALDELPRVSGSFEAKELGEECVFVNDHGNVTLYNADGSVAWDCV